MPTRAQVGRPDGVTNPSIDPDTNRTSARPTPCRRRRAPLRPERCARRGPGSITVHPRRSRSRRHEDRGEFEQSVWEYEPEEGVETADGRHEAAPTARLRTLVKRIQRTGRHRNTPRTRHSAAASRCSSTPGPRTRPRGGSSSTSRSSPPGRVICGVRGGPIADCTSGWCRSTSPGGSRWRWIRVRSAPTSGGRGRRRPGIPREEADDIAPGCATFPVTAPAHVPRVG